VRALFDVNVLIALLDADHIGHSSAASWFAAHLEHGWASCPITENGTARVMASSAYPNPLAVAAILERLEIAKATELHRFWPDDVSVTDTEIFNRSELLGPKQITDRYLLGLAVRNGGRLVTFDQGMRPTAVAGASSKHLVQLQG
jgi:toxin-antitoxin system PIN domain toxin